MKPKKKTKKKAREWWGIAWVEIPNYSPTLYNSKREAFYNLRENNKYLKCILGKCKLITVKEVLK